MTAGVLGVLVGLTCGAVAVAQAEPDYCRIQFQAAHEQYEQEVRTCNKQPSCLETAFKKFKAWKCITPAPGILETPKMDPSAKPTTPIPPLRPETPQMAPTTNADCDRQRNNLTQAAENQYTAQVRACNRNPACLQAAYGKWNQASASAEQAYNACRAQVAKGPLQGGASIDAPQDPLRSGVYNPDYGMKLPAMTGEVPYGGVTITVTTAKGRAVGQGMEGQVQIRALPPVYRRAMGFIDTATTFKITKLWNMQGQEVNLAGPIVVPIHPAP